MSAARRVPFNALAPGVQALRPELDAAVDAVLRSGWFVLGPQEAAFEQEFAAYVGHQTQCVGVASGTDALVLGLRALDVQPRDEVLVTANAGVPPVAAVVAAGARPVFCDVDPRTHTLAPDELERRVTPRTRALLVVHLYGWAAEMEPLVTFAQTHDLRVLEDCAQAHGARYAGQRVGTFGDAAAFSFYPTKNLGALGDGGAVVTRRAEVADRVRLLRQYGWRQKYLSEEQSTVSRLDELQGAVLRVKLRHLEEQNARRRAVAAAYSQGLAGLAGLELPVGSRPDAGREHVYHLYVTRVKEGREELRAGLEERGVGTDVHYPYPVHLQGPYREYGEGEGSLPVTEALAREVLSLPLWPELSQDDATYVVDQLWATLKGRTTTARTSA